jgi:hypothetical protein
MEGGHTCQGRQGTRLNGNLASSEGEEGAMALTITVEQASAILTQEVQRRMQKRPPTWSDGKSGNPSVLWAETAFEDRPGCNSIHEILASPWPGDLKRSNTSGANQGAWGLGGGKSTLQAYAGLAWGGLLNLSARISGECYHRG